MLFSRFWMVLLALVAGASIAAMTLARKTYDHDRATDVAAMVDGDRRIVEEFLRRDARTRLDDIGPVAADPGLVALMVTTTRRTADTPAAIGTAITARLRELNQGLGPLRGEIMFAVDPRGIVVGRVGLQENEVGQFVGGLALVERAIAGNVRDDIWEISGTAYRMAARPVISEGRYYVGAVVHGMAVQSRFVETLGQLVPGASVIVFGATQTYGDFHPVPERGAAAAPPAGALSEAMRTLAQRPEWATRGAVSFDLPEGLGRAAYGALPGSAGAGIAVGRGLPAMPADFLLHASKDDVGRVPFGAILSAVAGLIIVGFLLFYWEYDSKKKRLIAAMRELQKGPANRVDPLLLDGFARDVAVAANDGIDEVVKREIERSGGKLRSVTDLEGLLSNPGDAPYAPTNQRLPVNEVDEQRQWREVYDQFVARRRECGEGVDGVTWERFLATLQKSRAEVVSRARSRGARFTVVVKDGRAAVKAAPLN
jgi:hypothetical protein